MTSPDASFMNDFNTNIVDEFRSNAGVVGGPFEGRPLLLLHTTGAKSGKQRIAPLAYFTVDGKMIIIGSKAGADTNPDWVHNLRANPRPTSRSAPMPTTWSPASSRARSGTRPTRRSLRKPPGSASTRPRPAGSSHCSN